MNLTAAIIKDIRKLHTTKGRREAGLFLAEGIRTVLSLIEAGLTPQELYVTPEAAERLQCSTSYVSISQKDMNQISPSNTAPGILGLFSFPANPDPAHLSPGLVLANIADPGNMGTLIRSCAAFGFRSVIIIGGCDPFGPKVIQATAGALPHISLFCWKWQDVIAHKKNLSLCALDAQGGKPIEELNLTNTLFVVGNEAHGIPEEWTATCDTHLTFPLAPGIDSLNAAVAGSLALFLATKQ